MLLVFWPGFVDKSILNLSTPEFWKFFSCRSAEPRWGISANEVCVGRQRGSSILPGEMQR